MDWGSLTRCLSTQSVLYGPDSQYAEFEADTCSEILGEHLFNRAYRVDEFLCEAFSFANQSSLLSPSPLHKQVSPLVPNGSRSRRLLSNS